MRSNSNMQAGAAMGRPIPQAVAAPPPQQPPVMAQFIAELNTLIDIASENVSRAEALSTRIFGESPSSESNGLATPAPCSAVSTVFERQSILRMLLCKHRDVLDRLEGVA